MEFSFCEVTTCTGMHYEVFNSGLREQYYLNNITFTQLA